jgi:hypothetical protein
MNDEIEFTEKRLPENGPGRRTGDGNCPQYCSDRITNLENEVSWMRKIMITTLITGFMILLTVLFSLGIFILKINMPP